MEKMKALWEAIITSLEQYSYSETDELLINAQKANIISTPRKYGTRYVCTLFEVPENVTDITSTKKLISNIRHELSKKYAKFPYYKEVGTFIILSCSDKLHKKINSNIKSLIDKTGLHTTIILGVCAINNETKELQAQSTWGLFHSGKHFETITNTIKKWTAQE